MAKFKKLLGLSAIVGATLGALYYKKKSEENCTSDDFEEDDFVEDDKIWGFSTDGSDEGTKKVTITFNTRKAKQVASDAADTIEDVVNTAKDKVVDVIGEERIVNAKSTVTDAATKVKDKVVDTIGEDNINTAKSKINDVTSKTKDIIDETLTDENIRMAKEKVADAVDKTLDAIKKTANKVKSNEDIIDGDYSEVDVEFYEAKEEDSATENLDTEDYKKESADFIPEEAEDADLTQIEKETVEAITSDVPLKPDTASEPEFSDTSSNISDENNDTSTPVKKSVEYDFLADEVDDL